MNYRISKVEPLRDGVLRVTFEDGLSGEYDLTDDIENGPAFAPLKSSSYFKTVAVGEAGHSFGWNLDDIGHEIDFCADATRIKLKSQIVKRLASDYRAQRTAAE